MKTKLIVFIAAALLMVMGNVKAQDTASKVLSGPLPSPPFPSSDWDGGPVIGEPNDDTYYPLQKLMGWANNRTGIKFYGWIDVGGNLSSSKNSNAPAGYDIAANKVELDHIVLRFERDPNTAQSQNMDWGFLVDNIYGEDYRYTMAKGVFSGQLLNHNSLYGYDAAQFYGLWYVPYLAEGMLIKVGRFLSPSDIEDQWAPDNFLYTHSLMFIGDPFTFTGGIATIKFSKYVQFIVGVHAGNDIAPWSNSANLNGLAMLRWVAKNDNNSLYGGIPSIGKGYYTNDHDNLQMAVVTWGHRFSKTFFMMTESYYMWQWDARVGGTVINGPSEPYFMETGPGPVIPGITSAVGLVNYFEVFLSGKNYLSIRNEFLNDPQGNRTGFSTAYSGHTIGICHKFNDLMSIRPEIQYDRAYADKVTPFDNGTKKDQYTAAMDLIARF